MNNIGKRKTFEEYKEEYLGMKKGLLTVTQVAFETPSSGGHKRTILKGFCECGNSFVRDLTSFNKAKNLCCSRDCSIRYPDIRGKKFGRLSVLDYKDKEKSNRIFICYCDCGNITTAVRYDLLNGKVKSCGCLEKENLARIAKISNGSVKPGAQYGSLEVIKDSKRRNNNRQIIWECFCHECGKICYFPTADLYLGNRTHCGCKSETRSLGERTIEALLDANGIKYISQYSPEWAINPETNRPLPYDFFLPDYNYIIEYDGEQHYVPVPYFGGEKSLIETQKRDKFKNHLCFEHNVSLIRIPNIPPHKLSFSDLMLSISPYRIDRREEYGSCE